MESFALRLRYRSSSQTTIPLPFGARSVGHYRVRPGFRDTPAVKHFVQVFWGIAGTGALKIEGVEHRLQPRQIAVYFPGMRHEVYALDTDWDYVWWTMDGPLAVSMATSLGLGADVYDAGPAPRSLFRQLEYAIRDQSKTAERHASALAYRLLTLAVSGRQAARQDRTINGAIRIINQEWARSDLGVSQLADRLRLHRSSLSRRFEAAVGIPPVAYLNQLRIQNALSLLKQTDKPIAEIAALCGYTDPNYFSRQIHRYTGLSPRRFRIGEE